jgi:hypothetical protein
MRGASTTSRVRITSNAKLGNEYVCVLIKGLDTLILNKLLLRDNNLIGDRVMKQIQTVNLRVQELDLSENMIGKYISPIKNLMLNKGAM